MTDTPKGLC